MLESGTYENLIDHCPTINALSLSPDTHTVNLLDLFLQVSKYFNHVIYTKSTLDVECGA